MSNCAHCGAPIALSPRAPTLCAFCGAKNAPLSTPAPAPVQVIQRIVQVVGGPAAQAAAREPRCPHCNRPLTTVNAAEVDLHGCGSCGGIWLDNDGAQRVVASADRVFSDLAWRAAHHATSSRPRAPRPMCPTCLAVLDQVRWHDIDLDVCADHGTWFDAVELHSLVTGLRKQREAEQAAGPPVVCGRCARSAPSSRTNVTEAGSVCDDCYLAIRAQSTAHLAAQAPTGSVLLKLHAALYDKR